MSSSSGQGGEPGPSQLQPVDLAQKSAHIQFRPAPLSRALGPVQSSQVLTLTPVKQVVVTPALTESSPSMTQPVSLAVSRQPNSSLGHLLPVSGNMAKSNQFAIVAPPVQHNQCHVPRGAITGANLANARSGIARLGTSNVMSVTTVPVTSYQSVAVAGSLVPARATAPPTSLTTTSSTIHFTPSALQTIAAAPNNVMVQKTTSGSTLGRSTSITVNARQSTPSTRSINESSWPPIVPNSVKNQHVALTEKPYLKNQSQPPIASAPSSVPPSSNIPRQQQVSLPVPVQIPIPTVTGGSLQTTVVPPLQNRISIATVSTVPPVLATASGTVGTTTGFVSVPVTVATTGMTITGSVAVKAATQPCATTRTNLIQRSAGSKVIAQPPTIHISQVPLVAQSGKGTSLQTMQTVQTVHPVVSLQQTSVTTALRTVTYATTTSVAATRTTTASLPTVSSIPVAKVYPQPGSGRVLEVGTTEVLHPIAHQQLTNQPLGQPVSANVFITHRNPSYQVQPGPAIIAQHYAPGSVPFSVQTTSAAIRPSHQVHSLVASGTSVRLNPVMVVDQNRTFVHSPFPQDGTILHHDSSVIQNQGRHFQQHNLNRPNVSPRPSILRKREFEGSPLKAQKNLTATLNMMAPVSPPSPHRPSSTGNGHSSGSTTVSASSSPNLDGEDSLPPTSIKKEMVIDDDQENIVQTPTIEMSPRKKPRKQLLTTNELQETQCSEEDMEFLSEEKLKRRTPDESKNAPKRRATIWSNAPSIPYTYPTQHFLRYCDVKPKEDKLTVHDWANRAVKDFKIGRMHLQMEDLSCTESESNKRFTRILTVVEKKHCSKENKDFLADLHSISELLKGNIQRGVVACDQFSEAKANVVRISEHVTRFEQLVEKYSSKRPIKKRDKT